MLAIVLGMVRCELPSKIPIAAVFDEDQDRKHEWAFQYSVNQINQSPMWASILPGKQLVAQVIRVPTGNRFESVYGHKRI